MVSKDCGKLLQGVSPCVLDRSEGDTGAGFRSVAVNSCAAVIA